MTKPALFATYLFDAMNARRMPPEEFEHELGDVRREDIQSWLNGWTSPDLDQIPTVARALQRELAEVAAAWLIDRLPELHEPFYADVLKPRGSTFPAPGDLAIRRPTPQKAEVRENMDVGDPHDTGRSPPLSRPPGPEAMIRKRPHRRIR